MYQRTIEELQKDEREKVIIDIRREADFLRETYPGAKHIYWEEFEAHRDEVPKDRPVYLICYTGERSDELARELLEEGYEVYSVQGGYRAYLRMKLLESMEQTKAPDAEEKNLDRCSEIERSIVKKFRKEIWRKFTKAINEYELIQDGDTAAFSRWGKSPSRSGKSDRRKPLCADHVRTSSNRVCAALTASASRNGKRPRLTLRPASDTHKPARCSSTLPNSRAFIVRLSMQTHFLPARRPARGASSGAP